MKILLVLCAALCMADPRPDPNEFRALMRKSPGLPLKPAKLTLTPETALGMVSSVAADRKGNLYLLQRGPDADPVIVVTSSGNVLRSWGRGLYKIPHSIRIDPDGNVWTTDAASSMVYKFTPEGRQLLQISVGGLPVNPKSAFCGTTDIAFAERGRRIFIADGYANARILEYDRQGKKIQEWGKPGAAEGELHLPHAIAVGPDNTIYVADRENWRIQRFTLDGKFLGVWTHLGKTFSLKVGSSGDLWMGSQPGDVPNGREPWLIRVDRRTGRIQGVAESPGLHSTEVLPHGGVAVPGAAVTVFGR